MKSFIPIFLILFSFAAWGQTQKYTTIHLSTGDCRSNEAYFWRVDTVSFYKLPESTNMLKVIPRQYNQFPIKLKNIPVSAYRVTFKNNFGQLVVKQIQLVDHEINVIILCPDSLLEYSQNTLSKLQDSDTISINFHSQGCFHTTVSKMVIGKQKDNYFAKLYHVDWDYVTHKKKTTMKFFGDTLLQTVTLTPQHIQDFIRFENELNFVTKGGCTTTDRYEVQSKFLHKKVIDGSCSWRGYLFLRKALFGDEE